MSGILNAEAVVPIYFFIDNSASSPNICKYYNQSSRMEHPLACSQTQKHGSSVSTHKTTAHRRPFTEVKVGGLSFHMVTSHLFVIYSQQKEEGNRMKRLTCKGADNLSVGDFRIPSNSTAENVLQSSHIYCRGLKHTAETHPLSPVFSHQNRSIFEISYSTAALSILTIGYLALWSLFIFIHCNRERGNCHGGKDR